MIRIALAVALAMTFVMPAQARGLKLHLPRPTAKQVDRYPIPVVPGIGHAYRNQSDCGGAPKRPCMPSESSPLPYPTR